MENEGERGREYRGRRWIEEFGSVGSKEGQKRTSTIYKRANAHAQARSLSLSLSRNYVLMLCTHHRHGHIHTYLAHIIHSHRFKSTLALHKMHTVTLALIHFRVKVCVYNSCPTAPPLPASTKLTFHSRQSERAPVSHHLFYSPFDVPKY